LALKSKAEPQKWALLAMSIQTLMVGPGYVFAKLVTGSVHPLAVTQIRHIGTLSIFLVLAMIWQKDFRPILVQLKQQWPAFIALAFMGFFINQVTFIMGLRYTSPAQASILFALLPLAVLMISALIGKQERLTPYKLFCTLISLLGVGLIIMQTASSNDGSQPLLGNLYILGCVLSWASYMVFSKPFLQKFDSFTFTTTLSIIGLVLYLPVGLPALIAQPWETVPTAAFWQIAYITIFNAALSYLLVMFSIKHLTVSQVGIFTNAQPVVATLFSFLLGYDALSSMFLIGGSLTLTGIYLLNRR
jgi:drug/metabolite transporter (DMT)-like permease